MKRIDCKNCKHKFKGKFCPNCGQKSDTNEINLKYFTEELPYGLFQINRGLFFTIKELTIRPGGAVLDYIEGKRIRYFLPFSYIILMASFYLITKSSVQQFWMGEYYNAETITSTTPFLGFIFTSLSPILAICFLLVFGRQSKLNFWKYVIASIYFLGHFLFILLVLRLLYFPFPKLTTNSGWLASVSLPYLVLSIYSIHLKFFKSKLALLFKSILTFVLFLIFAALSIGFFIKLFDDF